MSDSIRWQPGRLVAQRYRVERFLDEGSAGEVYAAQNVWTGRNVALKRLRPEHQDRADVVERFLLEGRIGGRIDHPNIVQTFDMAQEPTDQAFFIVQELLQGAGLRELMKPGTCMPFRDVLDLVVPLLGALVAVHQHGVVHRDIKPENIFLNESSLGHHIPKLLDFGIAKVRRIQTLTQTGSLLGTLDYMAPEQSEARKDIDRRVDVWAMGVLMYELLTGRTPFGVSNPAVSLSRILTHNPEPVHTLVPEVPKPISDAIERAMEKDRQSRHDSVQQLLEDLLGWTVTSHDEHDRALTGRHRTSLPAAVEHKLRAGTGSIAPSSLSAALMVATRSGQVCIPESLRELTDQILPKPVMASQMDNPPMDPSAEASTELPPLEDTLDARDHPAIDEVWAVDEHIANAYSSLRRHAFFQAYRAAEQALEKLESEPERRVPLLLVQAEAAYWGGHYDAYELCLIEALSLATVYERSWFRCVGELAESSSRLGAHARLPELANELARATIAPDSAADYVVACSRLGIALQRAGCPEQVEAVLGRLTPDMYDLADTNPNVNAWLCLLRSELADHAGDHAHAMDLTKQAVSSFERSGDVRRACVYRGDIGNAEMLLGNYAAAERSLSVSLEEAAGLHLAPAATMRLNLGITLARLGRADEGRRCVEQALSVYIRRGDWGGECAARIYLAEILLMRGDHPSAEREARMAVERADVSPATQAEALGLLSLVQKDRPMEAFIAASQAMELLQSVGGVAEGEARIRLAYALALDGLGHDADARAALEEAEARLLERAQRISDETWRESFLNNVPDHAQTMALVAERGGR